MTAQVIDGAALATKWREELVREISALGFRPSVAALHNETDSANRVYMKRQRSLCDKSGIEYKVHPITAQTPEREVLDLIGRLNADPGVHGITVHQPLPASYDSARILAAVSPSKDIEAAHPENLGRLSFGEHYPAPCAASAAVALARSVRPSFRGLEAVVVGRSPYIGKAIAAILLQSKKEAPTPTICHTATPDLGLHTRRADLLFVATGRAGLVRGEMVKPGATVIDVGINVLPDGKITGDVVFEEAVQVAAHITPVPGGVGPVTHAILLKNILACVRKTS